MSSLGTSLGPMLFLWDKERLDSFYKNVVIRKISGHWQAGGSSQVISGVLWCGLTWCDVVWNGLV